MQTLKKVFNFRNLTIFGLGLTTGTIVTKSNVCSSDCCWTTSKTNFKKKLDPALVTQKWDHNWDQLSCPSFSGDQSKSGSTKATATRTIILVRHGQYNFDGKREENETHRLTPLGREQAKLLGQRLSKFREGVGGGFKSIVFSPMLRTTETATIACNEMGEQNFEPDPLLKEAIPCRPDPMPRTFKMDQNDENQMEKEARQLEAAFQKYFYRANAHQTTDSVEILVCHANVIRYFVCRALQLGSGAWLRFQLASLDHTSLTILKIYPDGQVRLERYADSSHLPDDKRTFQLEIGKSLL